jgi:hypothetical protein
MEVCGEIVRKPFAGGSKSARDAVMLITKQGEYVLRRLGGNAFDDPALADLVGRHVCCKGTVHGYTFIMTEWSSAQAAVG